MNQLNIIGNLTRDPETRVTPQGINVTDFTVAVNRRSKDGGTDYFRVTCWRGLAEIAAKYLSKGRKVRVTGPVSLSTYKGRDGESKSNLEVTADDLELLSPRDSAAPAATAPMPMQVTQPEDLPF